MGRPTSIQKMSEEQQRNERGNREIKKIIDDFKVQMKAEEQTVVDLEEQKKKMEAEFDERRIVKAKKAAEMAKRIENQRRASNAALMAAKEANQGDTKYNHAEARERAAGRKKKAPRRGFVSRETTPADFDQPIRLVKAA